MFQTLIVLVAIFSGTAKAEATNEDMIATMQSTMNKAATFYVRYGELPTECDADLNCVIPGSDGELTNFFSIPETIPVKVKVGPGNINYVLGKRYAQIFASGVFFVPSSRKFCETSLTYYQVDREFELEWDLKGLNCYQ